MSIGLVLVGAGSSRRMGDVDKVWADLGGHPIVWHSVSRLADAVDRCVLVARHDHVDRAQELFAGTDLLVVRGGRQRFDSVATGLACLKDIDVVAIHDVARPFATPDLLKTGIASLETWGGVVPVVPVFDTLKLVSEDGMVTGTIPRSDVRAVQTPQIFHADTLRRIHAAASDNAVFTDDAAMLEESGYDVRAFPGDPVNFKITTLQDLIIAQFLWESGRIS